MEDYNSIHILVLGDGEFDNFRVFENTFESALLNIFENVLDAFPIIYTVDEKSSLTEFVKTSCLNNSFYNRMISYNDINELKNKLVCVIVYSNIQYYESNIKILLRYINSTKTFVFIVEKGT